MSVLESPSTPLLPSVPAAARYRGMGLTEPFRVALGGLMANKMRSFLTMLGVIIGVSAVIVMVALGEGAAKSTEESIKKLGTNRLYIRPQELRRNGVSQGQGSGEHMRLEHVEMLRKQARYITAVAPEVRNSGIRVEYRNRNSLTDIYGVTPEYFEVRNLPLAVGRMFTAAEIEQKALVAILGHEVAEELFNDQPQTAVGKSILINSKRFRVIGVQKQQGAVPFANKDDTVSIPITTSMRRLFRTESIRAISVSAVSVDRMLDVEEEVYRIMAKAHKVPEGDPPSVRIFNQQELLETATQQSSFLTMLLSGIAAISLVVGGIGIMNIMLVTVTERTREIGIRRAIGAKRKHILYQFLIESVTLSLMGGMLGILIGIGLAVWMGKPNSEGGLGFTTYITMTPMLISFCSSAFVGIFFGIYPAMKASALNPIQALRHE